MRKQRNVEALSGSRLIAASVQRPIGRQTFSSKVGIERRYRAVRRRRPIWSTSKPMSSARRRKQQEKQLMSTRSQFSNGSRDGSAEHKYQRIANGLGWFSIGLGMAEIAAPGAIAEICGVR